MNLKKIKNLFLFNKKTPQKETSEVEEVCVFPLPNVVLLPGAVLPLHIFEDHYKVMMDDLLKSNLTLAMSFSRPASKKGNRMPSVICGAGKLNLLEQYPDGRKDVFVEGNKRLKIIKYLQKSPYLKALAKPIPDIPFSTLDEEKKYAEQLILLTRRWIFLSQDLEDYFIHYTHLFLKPHFLADFIGFYFLPTVEEKQNLLETVDQKKRVETILSFLRDKIRHLEKQPPKSLADWEEASKVLH